MSESCLLIMITTTKRGRPKKNPNGPKDHNISWTKEMKDYLLYLRMDKYKEKYFLGKYRKSYTYGWNHIIEDFNEHFNMQVSKSKMKNEFRSLVFPKKHHFESNDTSQKENGEAKLIETNHSTKELKDLGQSETVLDNLSECTHSDDHYQAATIQNQKKRRINHNTATCNIGETCKNDQVEAARIQTQAPYTKLYRMLERISGQLELMDSNLDQRIKNQNKMNLKLLQLLQNRMNK